MAVADVDLTILRGYVQPQGEPVAARGILERQVRARALAVVEQLAERGVRQAEAAQRLGVPARTLRHWQMQYEHGATRVGRRGRPVADAGAPQQQAVLEHLQAVGPGSSVASLRAEFPGVSRAELEGLLSCYRAVWRVEHAEAAYVLKWQRPGTVWAMDFSEAPALVDGRYPYLLAVRDLASGQQLLWRPVAESSGAVVRAELEPLFLAYGAPWVLKSDNGPAFRAEETKRLLARWQVFGLFSPPRTPTYNGSIEAAIGSLKSWSERLAVAAGHPGLWTSAVVEAARQEANRRTRPRRLHGATPAAVWSARRALGEEERRRFAETVAAERAVAWEEVGGRPEEEVNHWQEAAVDRVALRRALVAHDLLLFRRRRIPARIERPKAAING